MATIICGSWMIDKENSKVIYGVFALFLEIGLGQVIGWRTHIRILIKSESNQILCNYSGHI